MLKQKRLRKKLLQELVSSWFDLVTSFPVCLVTVTLLYCVDDSEASLMAIVKARQKSREEEMGSFFDSLEEKYCTKKSNTASSKKKGSSSSTKANGSKGMKK